MNLKVHQEPDLAKPRQSNVPESEYDKTASPHYNKLMKYESRQEAQRQQIALSTESQEGPNREGEDNVQVVDPDSNPVGGRGQVTSPKTKKKFTKEQF